MSKVQKKRPPKLRIRSRLRWPNHSMVAADIISLNSVYTCVYTTRPLTGQYF